MLKKHVISVRDMIMDVDRGIVPSQQALDDKLTDWINYGLLLEGLFCERRGCVSDPDYEDRQEVIVVNPGNPGQITPEIKKQVEDLGFRVRRNRPGGCDD
jgi:hypothetical protein